MPPKINLDEPTSFNTSWRPDYNLKPFDLLPTPKGENKDAAPADESDSSSETCSAPTLANDDIHERASDSSSETYSAPTTHADDDNANIYERASDSGTMSEAQEAPYHENTRDDGACGVDLAVTKDDENNTNPRLEKRCHDEDLDQEGYDADQDSDETIGHPTQKKRKT